MASLLERICFHEASHCVAAQCYSLPIIRVTIDTGVPHMQRGFYAPPEGRIGLEATVVVAVAGPIGEQLICGSISDESNRTDLAMARDCLRRSGCNELQVGMGLEQARRAAHGLLMTPWGNARVRLIAAELMKRSVLSGDDVAGLIG